MRPAGRGTAAWSSRRGVAKMQLATTSLLRCLHCIVARRLLALREALHTKQNLDREEEKGYRQRSERPPFRRHQRLNREHTRGIAGISRFRSVNNHNRTAGESHHVRQPLAVPAESGWYCAQQDVDANVPTLPEQPRRSEHCD